MVNTVHFSCVSVRVLREGLTMRRRIDDCMFSFWKLLYGLYLLYSLYLELQDSATHRGHFALYYCMVFGHTKPEAHRCMQRVYWNPFPAKQFYGSHRLDLVMIRPQGIYNPAPHAQPLSRRSRRPQAGCRRWMPDVARQLVGVGMVQQYVMNVKGFLCAESHG